MKNLENWIIGIWGISSVGILGLTFFLDFIIPILEHLSEEIAQWHVEIKNLHDASIILIGGLILKRVFRYIRILQKQAISHSNYIILLPAPPKRKRTRRIKWDIDTLKQRFPNLR